MNFQQLEYIVALHAHRNFTVAAGHCFVTQSTLSSMIQRLEEELDIVIFDRSKKPVEATPAGLEIIARAQKILAETAALRHYATELHQGLSGELRMAVIPTLAPYLLPLFVGNFLRSYPDIHLVVNELTTASIIRKLQSGEVEIGILALPLAESEIQEIPLFEEPFYVYQSQGGQQHLKKYLLPADLDTDRLWLLEEGHCLRTQVMHLCSLRNEAGMHRQLAYEAGSIEALIQLVDHYEGVTIVPHLAVEQLSESKRGQVYAFAHPIPSRTVGLVTRRNYPRIKILEALRAEIITALPPELRRL
ncbi:MAG: LysR family transcriptional regulator [Saprospiraceae bacterium]|jgi:LysR family hydrogen peroxide-inducible transcriptional activator|nr:LysR family transcriptional regulator [Saprospiraceae bacterium]